MDMRNHLHAPVAIEPVSIGQVAGWALEPALLCCRREKHPVPAHSNPGSSSPSSSHYTDYALTASGLWHYWNGCSKSGAPCVVDCVWNVMAHAQKSDFVFRRNGRVHLNRRRRQFSRLLAAEVWASAVVMLDTPYSEVVWRVLATHSIRHFPLHFPSRTSPCAITFQMEFTRAVFMVTGGAPSSVGCPRILIKYIPICRPYLLGSQCDAKPWRQGNHYVCTCPVTDTFDTLLL